jgi:hypothetical protein
MGQFRVWVLRKTPGGDVFGCDQAVYLVLERAFGCASRFSPATGVFF